MTDYPPDDGDKQRHGVLALVAFLAVLATGVILVTVGHLNASALETCTVALGALYMTWASGGRRR